MYRIIARIEADDTYGYSVHDYFRDNVLDREFGSETEAEAAAAAAYKGPDIHGVGCAWFVDES